jgi:ribosomal protein S18 acetylase RimI-like enzyme
MGAQPDADSGARVSVRPAGPGDLDGVVRVHRAAFPGFYMTLLGPRFLRLYYALVLRHAGGILLVAEGGDGGAEGFVAGFADPPGFYRLLRRNRARVALAVLPALLRSPRLVRRLATNAGRVDDSARGGEATSCELSSIGVAPGASGGGVGRALVAAFLRAAGERGAGEVFLTTDARENERVNRFYQECGFRLDRVSEPVAGRPMNVFVASPSHSAQAAAL